MLVKVSSSGTAGPGPASELKPKPPPLSVSSIQYDGATQSYGPGIFSPLLPSCALERSAADEPNGLGQSSALNASKNSFSTAAGGVSSLPIRKSITLG